MKRYAILAATLAAAAISLVGAQQAIAANPVRPAQGPSGQPTASATPGVSTSQTAMPGMSDEEMAGMDHEATPAASHDETAGMDPNMPGMSHDETPGMDPDMPGMSHDETPGMGPVRVTGTRRPQGRIPVRKLPLLARLWYSTAESC